MCKVENFLAISLKITVFGEDVKDSNLNNTGETV